MLFYNVASLARIIVYSMAQDSCPPPPSNSPTPLFTPPPSGMSTPQVHTSSLKEFLSAPLGRGISKGRTYLAGSKALDSLARLIASTESFFHPSNSGTWTADVCTPLLSLSSVYPWIELSANQMISALSAECTSSIHRIRVQQT
jgi:proteasome activator subunit 4